MSRQNLAMNVQHIPRETSKFQGMDLHSHTTRIPLPVQNPISIWEPKQCTYLFKKVPVIPQKSPYKWVTSTLILSSPPPKAKKKRVLKKWTLPSPRKKKTPPATPIQRGNGSLHLGMQRNSWSSGASRGWFLPNETLGKGCGCEIPEAAHDRRGNINLW